MTPNKAAIRLILACALAVLGAGCATTPSDAPVASAPEAAENETTTAAGNAPAASPAPADDDGSGDVTRQSPSAPRPDPPKARTDPGPNAKERAATAMEGMVIGGMVGTTIAGPVGAAAGAVIFGVYGAMTGDLPIGGGGSGRTRPRSERSRDAEMERELERELGEEVGRQDTLESAIEEELRRQEELLKDIDRREAEREIAAAEAGTGTAGSRRAVQADPRVAPAAPAERELPASIYDESYKTVAAGEWGEDQKRGRQVLARSLDADRDGAPEEIRYHDGESGVIVRKETDRDYDGKIDAWTLYEAGIVTEVREDNDGDGEPDEWQQYGRDGRMALREVDRDGDGRRDAFYVYEGGDLVVERHDGDSNGELDRVVYYQARQLSRTEEDVDKDGTMDTWTTFLVTGDEEVIARIERDADGEGTRDVFETYEQVEGRTYLAQREEDKNNDGEIDVKSVYQKGKLREREIRDPGLVPL